MKIFILLIAFISPVLLWAKSPYDHKDYTNQSFRTNIELQKLAGNQRGLIIENSSFYAESATISTSPAVNVFPPSMRNVEFLYCNLDNCIIPTGNVVANNCSNRLICANPEITYSGNTDDYEVRIDTALKRPVPIKSLRGVGKENNISQRTR